VPHQNPCPVCHELNLVRFERIIKGADVSRVFFCGACEHEWQVYDPGAPTPPIAPQPPLRKPRSRRFGPTR
jgi:hypothetical protein